MKNQWVTGILALTAGMAGDFALAKSTATANVTPQKRAERTFAKHFKLRVSTPARHRKDDGTYMTGSIVFNIGQGQSTPRFPNELHAEMEGSAYFHADVETIEGVEGNILRWVTLFGEGGILLDRIDHHRGATTYQIYGCETSGPDCRPDQAQLIFEDGKAYLSTFFGNDSRLEFQIKTTERLDDGTYVEVLKWRKNTTVQMEVIDASPAE